MKRHQCRICGHISEGACYKQSVLAHRDHFNATHRVNGINPYGIDALPMRIE